MVCLGNIFINALHKGDDDDDDDDDDNRHLVRATTELMIWPWLQLF